jgi:hypothetical protein
MHGNIIQKIALSCHHGNIMLQNISDYYNNVIMLYHHIDITMITT